MASNEETREERLRRRRERDRSNGDYSCMPEQIDIVTLSYQDQYQTGTI